MRNRKAIIPCQFCAAAWQVAMIPLATVRLTFFSYSKASDLPAKNSDGSPSVRRNYLPHDPLEFKQSIGDVEDSQEPRIFIPCEMKVVFHACDFRISDVTPVQRRQYIYYSSELLDRQCDMARDILQLKTHIRTPEAQEPGNPSSSASASRLPDRSQRWEGVELHGRPHRARYARAAAFRYPCRAHSQWHPQGDLSCRRTPLSDIMAMSGSRAAQGERHRKEDEMM